MFRARTGQQTHCGTPPPAYGKTPCGTPYSLGVAASSLRGGSGAIRRRPDGGPGRVYPCGGTRSMAVLIDASILIESERGRLDLEPYLAQRQAEEFFLSVVTASELLHGVHRAIRPEVRTKRAAFVEAILERFPLLPVD